MNESALLNFYSYFVPKFLLCARQIIYSYFVPIPTLRTDNSGIEPCKVGILTLSEKVRIPTLRRCNSGIVPIPTLRRTYICKLYLCLKVLNFLCHHGSHKLYQRIISMTHSVTLLPCPETWPRNSMG